MNHQPLFVLFALFDLAREDRPAHVGNVSQRIAASRAEVVACLRHLEKRGLVDAAACRLSLRGLATAATLRDARAWTTHGEVPATAGDQVRAA